jgi:hypothetical protein
MIEGICLLTYHTSTIMEPSIRGHIAINIHVSNITLRWTQTHLYICSKQRDSTIKIHGMRYMQFHLNHEEKWAKPSITCTIAYELQALQGALQSYV